MQPDLVVGPRESELLPKKLYRKRNLLLFYCGKFSIYADSIGKEWKR